MASPVSHSPLSDVSTSVVMAPADGAPASTALVSIEMTGSAARKAQAPIRLGSTVSQEGGEAPTSPGSSSPLISEESGGNAFSAPSGATSQTHAGGGGALDGTSRQSARFLCCFCPQPSRPPLSAVEEALVKTIEKEAGVAFEVRSRRRLCPSCCPLFCEPPMWMSSFLALCPTLVFPTHVARGERNALRRCCRQTFNAFGGNRQSVVGLVVLLLIFSSIIAAVASTVALSFPSSRGSDAEGSGFNPSSWVGKLELAILYFFTANYVIRMLTVFFVPPFEVHLSEDTGLWELSNAGAIARLEARKARIEYPFEVHLTAPPGEEGVSGGLGGGALSRSSSATSPAPTAPPLTPSGGPARAASATTLPPPSGSSSAVLPAPAAPPPAGVMLWKIRDAAAIEGLERNQVHAYRQKKEESAKDPEAERRRMQKLVETVYLLNEKLALEAKREVETAEERMRNLMAEIRVRHAIILANSATDEAEKKRQLAAWKMSDAMKEKQANDERYAKTLKARSGHTAPVKHFLKSEAFTSRAMTCCSSLQTAFFFFINVWSLVDLASFLPFWIQNFIGSSVPISFVRILRIIRIFLLFKFASRVHAFMGMVATVKRLIPSLAVVLASILLYGLFMAGVIFYLEVGTLDEDTGLYMRPSSKGADLEESPFRNILDALYFVVVTLTTVGYGDISATTTGGRAVASLLAISGVFILALPVGMMTSSLPDEIRRFRLQHVRNESKKLKDAGMLDEYGHREEDDDYKHLLDGRPDDAEAARARWDALVKEKEDKKKKEDARAALAVLRQQELKKDHGDAAFNMALAWQESLDARADEVMPDEEDDDGSVAPDSTAIYEVLTGGSSVESIPTYREPTFVLGDPTQQAPHRAPDKAHEAYKKSFRDLKGEIADLKADLKKVIQTLAVIKGSGT